MDTPITREEVAVLQAEVKKAEDQLAVQEEQKRLQKIAEDDVLKSLKTLDDWGSIEKINFFNKMHEMCMDTIRHACVTGHGPKDVAQYVWEAVMSGTLGPNTFDVYSDLVDLE